MRTAAGASMLRSDLALPFKDMVRQHDKFTMSVLNAVYHFNKTWNPDLIPKGDYNVVARGATSLIAKEVRGISLDQLAQTMKPEEMAHIDMRKFVEQRMAARDLEGVMLSPDEALRNQQQQMQLSQKMADLQTQQIQAEIRKTLTDAFKNIAQGQKNSAGADATTTKTALSLVTAAMSGEEEIPAEPQTPSVPKETRATPPSMPLAVLTPPVQ
jgi:Ni,Fe-hydrogenase I large subunit